MYLLKGLKHSPKNGHEYESVEDQKDLHIPVQNEDAFKHGIIYKAKYIGTQEITRPSSRVEIVSAMRRIRYEYKYRNIKKRKVNMDISVEGIKVTISKKKKVIDEAKYDNNQLLVMCYPINRVFYVSHDSQDLLIFSYIARGEDGLFRCSVFKSFKKSQAMNIVRTIGQAFEVCHKMNADKGNDEKEIESKDEAAERLKSSDEEGKGETDIDEVGESEIDQMNDQNKKTKQDHVNAFVTDIDAAEGEGNGTKSMKITEVMNGELPHDGNQLHQFYIQQLRHHKYETDAAKAEVYMLKQQLKIENETRINAQNRIEQLIAQNRELLGTIQKLMHQVQSSTDAKDMFDPIDESWMTSSFPLTDSYFSKISQSRALTNKVTSECISSVYDNVVNINHQSNKSENIEVTANKNSTKDGSSNAKNKLLDEKKEEENVFENNREVLSQSVGEKIGGISRSFTDLSKIGLEDKNMDVNHNADRITKFSNERDENLANDIVEKSVLSKEMMETFSEELNELNDDKKATSVTAL